MKTLESLLSADFDIKDEDLLIGSNYYITPNIMVHSDGKRLLQKQFRKDPPEVLPPIHDPSNKQKGVLGVILDWIYCQQVKDLPENLPLLYREWWQTAPSSIKIVKASAPGCWDMWIQYNGSYGPSPAMIVHLKPKK